MKNDYILAISIAGFIAAIFLCSFMKIGITFSLFLIFLPLILFLYVKLITTDEESRKIIFLIIITMISFSAGIIRYEIKDSASFDLNLENNIDQKVVISGIISDEIRNNERQAILVVDFANITLASTSMAVFGRGIVSTDLYPEYKYGDLIKISGKLEKPENFSNIGEGTTITSDPSQIKSQFDGASFDYISYLAKDDIFYKIDFAKTELISEGHGNFVKSFLFKIKDSFINNLSKIISEPESSLLSGILLGAKSSIDKNTTEIFRKAGLSHIIALSGYNITIVSDAIMKVFAFLPRNGGFILGIFGIIFFVLMTGASSTAVRAGVMALIVILAKSTRRNYQAGRALIIAGLMMVIVNPKILVFDISFQLSFLATIAIIYVAPVLKNRFTHITDKFGLRDIISSTISAQILVLPLILNKMGLLSLVALPANIFVLTLIPMTMFFGFITGVFSFIWFPLSLPLAWVSWILLAYIIIVSEFFASLPFSSVNIPWFSSSIMIACYFVITFWIIKENAKIKSN